MSKPSITIPLREMKTNVIDDYSVFRFGADRQWILRIVAIDADGVRTTGNCWMRISWFQLIGKRECEIKSAPLRLRAPPFDSRRSSQ